MCLGDISVVDNECDLAKIQHGVMSRSLSTDNIFHCMRQWNAVYLCTNNILTSMLILWNKAKAKCWQH